MLKLRLIIDMINKRRLIRLTQDLIRINSQNPPGNEYEISKFVKNYLKLLGIKTKIYEFKKGRSNLVARLEGENKRYTLLLSPHLDTVPAGGNWKFHPFKGTIYKKRIYGRGATDDKGNLACALEAMHSLVEEKIKLNYNLLFASTADEESGSKFGLIPLIDKAILKPHACLILDADDFNIVIAQKGLIHLKIKIRGKKAHGAYPYRGENAIDKAIRIIQDIERYRFRYKPHPLLRAPTVNIGTIHGGDKVNIVSDWCEFQLDIRFLPGMPEARILDKIKKVIKKYTNKFSIEIESLQKPYQIDKRHRLVNYLIKAMRNLKMRPNVSGSEGATVMTLFQDKDIAAVAFGFGSSGQSHMTNEYVKIDNLYKGAMVLEEFLKSYRF